MARNTKASNEGYNDILPKRIRELKEKRGVSQKKLAEVLDTTPQNISLYENGLSKPSWISIIKLAIFFHVSTDYLLGIEPEPTPDPEMKAMCKYTGLTEEALNVLHYYASGNFLRAYHGEYNLLISALLRSKTFEEVLHSIDVANSWKQKELTEGFKSDEEGDLPDKYTVDDLTNAQEILFSVGDIWVTWGEFAEYHAQKSAYLFQGLARQIAGIDEPDQKDITKTKGFIEFMQEEGNGPHTED